MQRTVGIRRLNVTNNSWAQETIHITYNEPLGAKPKLQRTISLRRLNYKEQLVSED